MTVPSDTALVRELRDHIHEVELQNTDLKRQVAELRAAVAALMEPPKDGEFVATYRGL